MLNEVAKCYIRQMHRELRDFAFLVDRIEKLVNNPNDAGVFHSNAEGLAYYQAELADTRKFFNKAFRNLRRELAE